jgi:hypothetical protein
MEKVDPKQALAHWIQERELVRQKKEAGLPKPWSQDWVFQETYFCNVRREDDRVTRWIRGNWSPDKIGWDDYEYAMVVARFLNWPDTLARLTYEDGHVFMPEAIGEELDELAEHGNKVWGNAYVVTTHGLPMGKAQYLCQRVLPAAYDLLGAARWRNAYSGSLRTLAYRHDDYMQLEGMGSFMSAQVLADLKNTPGHPLYEADDWYSWSAPGPGSLRGLEWYHGRKIKLSGYEDAIHDVALDLTSKYPEAAKHLRQGLEAKINMQDLQNCLCEYDKYMRVRSGSGRSKRGYPGK